jgi:hypothetical protein
LRGEPRVYLPETVWPEYRSGRVATDQTRNGERNRQIVILAPWLSAARLASGLLCHNSSPAPKFYNMKDVSFVALL